MILLDLGCQVGRQNRSKIDQKSHRKNDAKNKAVWDASWAVFGPSRGPRRTPTQPDALEILPWRPPGPPPFRAKIPDKKEISPRCSDTPRARGPANFSLLFGAFPIRSWFLRFVTEKRLRDQKSITTSNKYHFLLKIDCSITKKSMLDA